jgi:NitT/TauT family transport system substrate-binding protein
VTKRALRAILKATDLCATAPEQAARRLVDGGFARQYDYALQSLRELLTTSGAISTGGRVAILGTLDAPVCMLNSTPNKLLAKGTNWRFLNEIKRELKA